jgi:hypothetical protein
VRAQAFLRRWQAAFARAAPQAERRGAIQPCLCKAAACANKEESLNRKLKSTLGRTDSLDRSFPLKKAACNTELRKRGGLFARRWIKLRLSPSSTREIRRLWPRRFRCQLAAPWALPQKFLFGTANTDDLHMKALIFEMHCTASAKCRYQSRRR